MKNYHSINLLLLSMIAITFQSNASAEVGLRIKTGLGVANYTSPSNIQGQPDLKMNFKMLNLGASLIELDSGVFIDLTNRSTLGSPTYNTSELTGGLIPDLPGERSENTITVGKILSDGYSVFGGYQKNSTTLTIKFTSPSSQPGEATLDLSGPFLGASKALNFGRGVVSTSAALAMMSAKVNDNLGSPEQSYSAGLGFSLGISYSYPITDTIGLSADGKLQTYKPKDYGAADRLASFSLGINAKF